MVLMKNNLYQPLSSNRKLAHLIELGRRYLNFLLHSNLWATLYMKYRCLEFQERFHFSQ